ncbi:hypothetical protein GCM10007939_09660 [Amylibacter marinus]|uniref:Uncharacterized protein n=1 Tax=Amylibacter marinus TaxID=1475483 RepID=A0ABQ5VTY1_9RHOB|nr:hypothetical protein GCM10007939_09660 [Amylibacter marinus]
MPKDLIRNPQDHQGELEEFSRDLKEWWRLHSTRLRPDGYHNRIAYYKMHTMGGDVNLPESLINWMKDADITRDRRSWKAVEKSILTGKLFKSIA